MNLMYTLKEEKMERKLISGLVFILIVSGLIVPDVCSGQNKRAVINKYLKELPSGKPAEDGSLQKYRMTAVYTNMDIYGNFMSKIKVTGDYTRGLENGFVTWENIFIANSNTPSDTFPAGVRQEYMENIKYIPSGEMVTSKAFKDWPTTPDNVFARNLIWDMLTFEMFAWDYLDSLKLNQAYIVPDIKGEFDMAEIGKYSHDKIIISWKGISAVGENIFAVIDFNAIDNKMELNMDMIKSKGTEQYWGTILISLDNKYIENGIMYGGNIQEMEIKGLKDKLTIKTIRELEVTRIQ